MAVPMRIPETTYGSEKDGLVCAYVFGPGRPADGDEAAWPATVTYANCMGLESRTGRDEARVPWGPPRPHGTRAMTIV